MTLFAQVTNTVNKLGNFEKKLLGHTNFEEFEKQRKLDDLNYLHLKVNETV